MRDKTTILSVDDDEDLQYVVKEYLESEGYKVFRAHNLKEFDMWAEQGSSIDLVLLDLVLKDTEGLSLIGVIKDKIGAPIIVVNGKPIRRKKLSALRWAPMTTSTKPFEMRELTARIRAVIRRGAAPRSPALDSAAETSGSGG